MGMGMGMLADNQQAPTSGTCLAWQHGYGPWPETGKADDPRALDLDATWNLSLRLGLGRELELEQWNRNLNLNQNLVRRAACGVGWRRDIKH